MALGFMQIHNSIPPFQGVTIHLLFNLRNKSLLAMMFAAIRCLCSLIVLAMITASPSLMAVAAVGAIGCMATAIVFHGSDDVMGAAIRKAMKLLLFIIQPSAHHQELIPAQAPACLPSQS